MDLELNECLRHENDAKNDIWAELGTSMPPLDFAAVYRWLNLITTPQVEEVIALPNERSSMFLKAWNEMLKSSVIEEFRRGETALSHPQCVRVSRFMVPQVWERERALLYLSAQVQLGENEIKQALARLDPFIHENTNAPFEPFGWAKPVEEGYMFWLWENDPAEVKDRLLRTHNLLPEASLPYQELRLMMERLNHDFTDALPAHPASKRPALRARRTTS